MIDVTLCASVLSFAVGFLAAVSGLVSLKTLLSAAGDEERKIEAVAYEVDRFFSLLQLQNAYDSNEFSDSLFRISEQIREKPATSFRAAFDAELTSMIAGRRNVMEAVPLGYAAFKQTGINLNTRFKRYFFARIDEFPAEQMNLNPKHLIGDLVTKTPA